MQTALLDTANRLLSLAATLDGIVQVSREKVSLLQILEQIRRYMLQTLLPSARRVTIHVGGEDVIVSADCASSVALVVNELVQNALKYAFPSGQAGRIGIELHSGRPLCQLTVWDNGVGFQADRGRSSPASGAWRAVPAGRGSPSTFWSSKTKSCADLRLWRRVQEHGRCSPGTAQALPLGCFA